MLESRDVVKKYIGKTAVDQFNVNIENGCIYGLLGPNGSGKSTWMKMVTGLLVPTSGEITLDGKTVGKETKSRIAYMPTEPFYYSFMKIRDVGKYYEDFFDDYDPDRFITLINRMELDMNARVKTLSSGQAAKLKISATLSRHAELYLLDEPLNGIDLLAREEIVNTIIECVDSKSSLVVSSHLVEELEKIIDHVIFVRDGSVVLAGDVENLRAQRNESIVDMYREIYR